ncbi:MAG TPA: Ran-binding zinc finger domain-containing protein [Pyrinomonadaceae bacterium]|nr:Ran-binding zinc finger domain-containing protein [Pyrinomonadaceae bacterium]
MNSIKCPECGLVNFATANECKRCQMSFAPEHEASQGQYPNPEYQSYWPQNTEPETKQRVFSSGVVVLLGILALGFAILVLQQALHPFDVDTAKGVGGVLAVVGVLLLVLTHIWLLIRIFEQSVGWGLASLFVPAACYIAIGKFWEKTKRSFVGQMVCVGIVFVGVGIGL